jgi:hypothetical protein
MHLTQATNGYGGKINYTYESWNELYTQDGKTLYQNFDTICPASEGSWQEYPVDDYNDVDCKVRDAKNVLYIKGAAKRTLDLGLFHPAGVYEIKLQGVTGENGNVAYLGLNDGVNDSYLPVGGFPCAGYFAHPFEFSSNGDARRKPFSEIYSNLSKID